MIKRNSNEYNKGTGAATAIGVTAVESVMKDGVDPDMNYKHDVFNLIYLPFIILVSILYFVYSKDTIYIFACPLLVSYMIIDIVWLLLYPRSVPSPALIIAHHVLALIGWSTGYYDITARDYTIIGIQVESNTWFLTARRVFKHNQFNEIFFYITWFGIRVLYHPIKVYQFYTIVLSNYNNGIDNIHQWTFLVIASSLMLLNAKWTIDLVLTIFRRMKRDSSSCSSHYVDKKGL